MQPKIYSKQEHGIHLKQIDPHAIQILHRLNQAGYESYLVGGGVRDLVLGHTPKDYDISTAAKPEEVKKLFRNCILIGRRFRLAHIRFGKKVFEVSTFRRGDIDHDALITRDNEWGSAEEDVLRRDFTINGLFYDSEKQQIIDFVGGYQDLLDGNLKCIGQPHLRFKQDPVRMIRLLKFEARFGLNVDEDLKIALLDCRSELLKSSQARILEELFRMLESGASEKFIRLMSQHGLLQQLLQEVSEFLETDDAEDIYRFLCEIDMMYKENPKLKIHRPILLACLVFPMFDRYIKSLYVEKGKAPHLGIIQTQARAFVQSVFAPFFHLPKRIKAALVSIITSQYRLTPLEKRKRMPSKMPRLAEGLFSLRFLNLRQNIEPGISMIWQHWNRLYLKERKKLS